MNEISSFGESSAAAVGFYNPAALCWFEKLLQIQPLYMGENEPQGPPTARLRAF
jgi:hypothetical protein